MRTCCILLLLSWCQITLAQNPPIIEKRNRANAFVSLSDSYSSRAINGTLSQAGLDSFTRQLNDLVSHQLNYSASEEGQQLFTKLNLMRCYTVYVNVLLRLKRDEEVISIARNQSGLSEDPLIVDLATWKAAHQYDYGDRVNDKYDQLKTGGYIMERTEFLKPVGNFYLGLIIAAQRMREYALMDSLFLKGIKYGYFKDLAPVIKSTIAMDVLSTYKDTSHYSMKYLEAAMLFKESFPGLNETQKQTNSRISGNKVAEILTLALQQDVTQPEGIIAFNAALKNILQDPQLSNAEKAGIIKANTDRWLIQSTNANQQWLLDKSLYTLVTPAITQLLFDPADQQFCNQFAAFVNTRGTTIAQVNQQLAYTCYLYYKNSGQKKLASKFYKDHLKPYGQVFPE
jgi:hypothetical protein